MLMFAMYMYPCLLTKSCASSIFLFLFMVFLCHLLFLGGGGVLHTDYESTHDCSISLDLHVHVHVHVHVLQCSHSVQIPERFMRAEHSELLQSYSKDILEVEVEGTYTCISVGASLTSTGYIHVHACTVMGQ